MGDLFAQLKERRVLPERQVQDVILQLVAAVAGLHRNNICHRDIKPENILLERSQLNSRGVVVMVSFLLPFSDAMHYIHAGCSSVMHSHRINFSLALIT